MILDPSKNAFAIVPTPLDENGQPIDDLVRIDCALAVDAGGALPFGLDAWRVQPERRLHTWGDVPGVPLVFPDLAAAQAAIPAQFWAADDAAE